MCGTAAALPSPWASWPPRLQRLGVEIKGKFRVFSEPLQVGLLLTSPFLPPPSTTFFRAKRWRDEGSGLSLGVLGLRWQTAPESGPLGSHQRQAGHRAYCVATGARGGGGLREGSKTLTERTPPGFEGNFTKGNPWIPFCLGHRVSLRSCQGQEAS